MMISETAFILSYLSVLSALCAGGAVYWSVMNVRRLRTQHDALASNLAAAIRELEMVAALAARSATLAERFEPDYTTLTDRVGMLELRGENRPYNQAINSARSGADPAKLARQFGLSTSEANLLMLVHGARSGRA
jgi:hypothetical protein